jgi:shikimate kinase
MSDRPALTGRTIALVGLMGVGKTSIGRRLAKALGLPFRDADVEIERAAGRSVSDIFAALGEAAFRDGERKVIARLLAGRAHVLATGGGAFSDPETRALLKRETVTVWLRADLDTQVERVSRRNTRPLLREKDPRQVLTGLMERREPHYAEAEIVVGTAAGPHEAAVQAIIDALRARLESAA